MYARIENSFINRVSCKNDVCSVHLKEGEEGGGGRGGRKGGEEGGGGRGGRKGGEAPLGTPLVVDTNLVPRACVPFGKDERLWIAPMRYVI